MILQQHGVVVVESCMKISPAYFPATYQNISIMKNIETNQSKLLL